MVEVVVMYGDFEIKRAPLEEANTLPTHHVLHICVRDPEVEGAPGRIAMESGKDNYMLLKRRFNRTDWIMLIAYDEELTVWRRAPNCNGCQNRMPTDLPVSDWHMTFRGAFVPDEQWEESKRLARKM